jgi:hypothetical protein
MIREAKRVDFEYKRSAVAELARYLSAFQAINLFESLKEIVEQGLEALSDEDDDLQMKPMYVLFIFVLTIVDLFSAQTYTPSPQRAFNL